VRAAAATPCGCAHAGLEETIMRSTVASESKAARARRAAWLTWETGYMGDLSECRRVHNDGSRPR